MGNALRSRKCQVTMNRYIMIFGNNNISDIQA